MCGQLAGAKACPIDPQVIVLITLLTLAPLVPSPVTHRPQSHSAETCPHPELFQTWIGFSIARLVLCWSASFWICLRARQSGEGQGDDEGSQVDVERGDEHAVEVAHGSGTPRTPP